MKKLLFNLHQFDGGEGGEGGDAGHESGTTVLYGKQEEEFEGLNDAGRTEEPEDHDAGGEDESQKRQEEFDKLIKGDFKDLYDKAVKDNIDRRFRNSKGDKEQLEKINRALLPIYDKFGLDVGDVDGLESAILSDMTIYADEAAAMGMSPEQFNYAKRAEIEAMRATNELEKARGAQEAERTYKGWLAEAEELKESYPDFDLETEIQDERFMGLLKNNWSVSDAYEAIHAKELISRGIGTAAEKAQQNVVNNIKARGRRPAENGTGNKPGVIVKKDPSQFDDKDLEEIRRRVSNGEKIVL